LLLAAGPTHHYLTSSGAYYIPFGWPSPFGVHNVALHIADGSGIFSQRTRGPRLAIAVARGAGERYGNCVSRLRTPQLADGYLPILQTSYVDASGVPYEQESFATRIPQTRSLVSFVRLTADASASDHVVRLFFRPSTRGLAMSKGGFLVKGRDRHLFVSDGAHWDGSSVTYEVMPGTRATVYVAWLVVPGPAKPFALDAKKYVLAREGLVAYWSHKLATGATYAIPEGRVVDAARSVLIQNLTLGWRYSIGDGYHTKFSTPEGIDAAGVLGAYGFPQNNEAILRLSFWRGPGFTPNWKMGEQLLGSARYYSLYGDRAYVATWTPRLAAYVGNLERQLATSGIDLLNRERYSADLHTKVFGLHSQAIVWEGLRAMADVWADTGQTKLAVRARFAAANLAGGLRRAIRKSARRLPDGSLFVPVRLLDGERPYKRVAETWDGSYWNLVAPYAFASGIMPPHSAQATGVLRYLYTHGSRLVGLVRAGAFTLYGRSATGKSGTDQVYGLNMARFLADNDCADQLVLSLYGQLAVGMTPGTHVSGEAATVTPIAGEFYRRMFLPPNSGSNATFLETLRLMLVHEDDTGGVPHGLELAFATPRSWLRPGRQIRVIGAPTTFGTVSYTLRASDDVVRASVEVPRSLALRTLKLRLRLPFGERITQVLLDDRPYRRFDPANGTIELTGRRGRILLEARYRSASDTRRGPVDSRKAAATRGCRL